MQLAQLKIAAASLSLFVSLSLAETSAEICNESEQVSLFSLTFFQLCLLGCNFKDIGNCCQLFDCLAQMFMLDCETNKSDKDRETE